MSLKSQNAKLKAELNDLRNSKSLEQASVMNTLSSLVAGQQMQSELTSIIPILQNNLYSPLTVNWTLLTYMYKTHGIIQTAIDVPVLDALRGGLDIHSSELDVDDIKDLSDALEHQGILDATTEGEQWARLYGGGALIINNGQDPEKPLDEANMKGFELYAANRWELTTSSGWKPDMQTMLLPFTGGMAYATANEEFFYFYGKKIHKSRVLILTGKAAPYIIRWQLAGWGMSEVERMVGDFNAYIKTKEVLYELLEEAKIDVYRLKGLNNQMTSQAGTQKTQDRIGLMNQLKNFQRAIVMDLEDEFEQKQITFSGLAEVMKENRIGIASALRMPMTKLFGLSATGLNAGEEDLENYNAMVESEVRQKLRRPLRKILMLLCRSMFGYEPDLSFDFKPLRVLGAVEEEAIRTSKQNRYLALFDRALIDSTEVGEITEKEKLVPVETKMSAGLLEDHPVNPATEAEGDDGDGNKKEKKKND